MSNEDLSSLDWSNMSPEEFSSLLVDALENDEFEDEEEPSTSPGVPKPLPTKS